MNILKPSPGPSGWTKSFLWLVLAVACFHAAYTSIKFPLLGLLIFGYAYSLVQLTNQPTIRRAFYFGLATGFLCAAPQLFFFWKIFGAAAIVLWLVFAFWIGLFTAISCGCLRRWGKPRASWLIPFIWTGLEYFRSELYYFKFSWLNIGYTLSDVRLFPFGFWGMYGVGFLAFIMATILFSLRPRIAWAVVSAMVVLFLIDASITTAEKPLPKVSVVGIQLEFPPENLLPHILNQALAKNTNAPVFVLSEYTLQGPVPESLRNWCHEHSRYLVVGGEDPVGTNNYYNTVFVVGTNGEVVFRQAKSVPIQFFKDGLPATNQEVWNSPWGKIGICICYDLSYTRVTDRLVEEGAQLLIVPTMDVRRVGPP